MPKIIELLNDIKIIHEPGKKFQYSGGGFLVLEHLLEAMENNSFIKMVEPFLSELNLTNLSFDPINLPNELYASGFDENGQEIIDTRKMFPAFAAGATGTAIDVNNFLIHLTKAYTDLAGSGPISHDTAVNMLYGIDLGSKNFMNCQMGLGIFTAEAGPNKFAIHQGANDGFRALFLFCFNGPNCGQGFTILCNGEINGVLFISEVAHLLISELNLQGFNKDKFHHHFDKAKLSPEEIVNIGYKKLIFDAFLPTLPEKIIAKGPLDPLVKFNLVIDGKISEVSNEKFARSENLISPFEPVFSPDLFGDQGKIMDSWETVRHNQNEFDSLVIELKKPEVINFVSLSTAFHNGNHVPWTKILGQKINSHEWNEILPKQKLNGHAIVFFKIPETNNIYAKIKVLVFPDGGLTRLGLYKTLPDNKIPFDEYIYPNDIPKTLKPLSIKYTPMDSEIEKNFSILRKGQEFDAASIAFGGKVIYASNEHYGPAIQSISPFAPMHMFDGFESARSREDEHNEELIIEFKKPSTIKKVILNFSFFVNNNPMYVSLFGKINNEWIQISEKTFVKPFAGNKEEIKIKKLELFSQIKIIVFPDGGINRVKIISEY
jgi:allantoicase